MIEARPFPRTRTPIQVRYSDTDAIGHVSNANYLHYTELGRTTLFRQYVEGTQEQAPIAVVVNIDIDYLAEIRFGQEVIVDTYVEEIGSKSMVVIDEIYADGHMASRAKTTLVGFDRESRQSMVLPSHWRPTLME